MMNCNEDISFLLFMKCDPTSVLPLSLVCKQYRSVFLARKSVICQSHVERRIMTTFSAKDQAKQQKDLQKKLHIITMNFDHVRPCLADANQIFHDFCKKRWWHRLERYQLYSAIKNRSEWFQIHKISPQTINYIFKVWNGAVYYVEAQEANDIIFSIVFAPKEDEEDTADNLTETRLKWLQDNFGRKFPKRNLIFLNPSNEMCEYRRSMYEHVNVDGSSGNDVSSSSEPQFSKYVQIPLETALRRAIRGLSAEPESKSDAGMELFDYLNRYPTVREEFAMWSRCTAIFLDFGKKWWWQILTSYKLYSAVKDRSAWFEEFKISLRTVNYIFNLFNGAVYDAEIHGDEMIFGIIFGSDVDEDTRLKWLQEKFGNEFPKMDLIFLNPSNETLEYRRPKHGTSSSSMPRFLGYYQIPLKTAIEHALGRGNQIPGMTPEWRWFDI
ncbi:hypothetical protein HDU77_010362 [Chytriomyces hyalinus]|nr:hypothetical protein HDU77_010362 [Chytriomyces hyalinus]